MAKTLERPRTLYEADLLAWLEEQAGHLRAGRFDVLDVANLIEEIEAMAGSRRRELKSRLRVLLLHLLKWDNQPRRRTRSWASTIAEQRAQIVDLFEENPSLRRELEEAARAAYPNAAQRAAIETSLPRSAFPDELPYPMSRILGDDQDPTKN